MKLLDFFGVVFVLAFLIVAAACGALIVWLGLGDFIIFVAALVSSFSLGHSTGWAKAKDTYYLQEQRNQHHDR